MIRVIVTGCMGRMGKCIAQAVLENKDMRLVGGTERAGHAELGRDIGEILGIGAKKAPLVKDIGALADKADVIIDFTAPLATMRHLDVALAKKVAMVIGTTGLGDEDKNKILKAGKNIGIVMAPNMSIGVSLLFSLVGEVAQKLGPDYDIEVIETHHRFKKDAPSGTAVKLAEIISEAQGQKLKDRVVYGREGMTGERKKGSIAIHAVRSGDVVGEHTVVFGNLGERIELTHRAHSRETFARGAVRAAEFIIRKGKGFFTMQDVLNAG